MELFRMYDLRGRVPEDINPEIAYKIGRAYVTFLKCKQVMVGHDHRSSSKDIHTSLIKGITDQGCDVIDIGLVNTDLMYYAVIKYKKEGGIVVTASHMGKEFNGMKIVKEKAIPIYGENGNQDLKKLVQENKWEETEKGKVTKMDLIDEYVDYILSYTDTSTIKPFKVVCDAGNGMAGLILPRLFEKLPCELIPLYLELDGTFPNHESNPLLPEAREVLKKTVVKEKADLGVIWDGDADRISMINEKGEFLQSDILTGIFAKQILKQYPGTAVVYDLRSSWFTKESIESAGGIPVAQRVGHPFIKIAMKEHDAHFSGELSGHSFFKIMGGYVENGFIPLLIMLKLMSDENKTPSELAIKSKKYFHSGEINFNVKNKEAVFERIKEKFKDNKPNFMDGITVEFDDYHFNVRESANDPVIRLNLEANSKKLMEEKLKELTALIKQ
ncbi:phosphomannomutase/phosphoglucomutase [Nanoarchaeota archaeon]